MQPLFQSRRATRFYRLSVARISIALTLLLFVTNLIVFLRHSTSPSGPQATTRTFETRSSPSFAESIRAIYQPVIPAYDADFTTLDGSRFSIPLANWTEPLGKDLCIVNVDTRPMNDSNQPWASEPTSFDWQKTNGWTGSGYLNQYLYSLIHGYRYIYLRTASPAGYVSAWARPGAYRAILPECRVIVYADSDVIYANLQLPFEWLLNHWEVPINTSSISMGMEPKQVPGWNLEDRFGNHLQNNGFLIIHNAPGETLIDEMMHKWSNCLTEVDYPGCAHLNNIWPAEMGGFNDYVRYDFPELVRTLPCNEALGWPEWDLECKGLFMRHYTLSKELVKPGIEQAVSSPLMTALQRNMVGSRMELLQDKTDQMWVGRTPDDIAAMT